jgi:hypothetical protein
VYVLEEGEIYIYIYIKVCTHILFPAHTHTLKSPYDTSLGKKGVAHETVENVSYCKSGYLIMPSASREHSINDRMIEECGAVSW